jgi:hypothetical protein
MNSCSYDGLRKILCSIATASARYRLAQTASLPGGAFPMRKLLYFAAATVLASTLALAQTQSPNQPMQKQKQTTQTPSQNEPTGKQRAGSKQVNRDRTTSRTTVKGRTGMRHARAHRGSRTYAYRSARRNARLIRGSRMAYGYRHHRHMRYARHGGRAYGYRAYARRYRGCD